MTNPGELIALAASGFSLVAVEGREVVGFLLAFRLPLPSTRLYVWQVPVAGSHRRAGVATLLYSDLIERARTSVIDDIRANVDLDNVPSLRLHASLGFSLQQRVQATYRLR